MSGRGDDGGRKKGDDTRLMWRNAKRVSRQKRGETGAAEENERQRAYNVRQTPGTHIPSGRAEENPESVSPELERARLSGQVIQARSELRAGSSSTANQPSGYTSTESRTRDTGGQGSGASTTTSGTIPAITVTSEPGRSNTAGREDTDRTGYDIRYERGKTPTPPPSKYLNRNYRGPPYEDTEK